MISSRRIESISLLTSVCLGKSEIACWIGSQSVCSLDEMSTVNPFECVQVHFSYRFEGDCSIASVQTLFKVVREWIHLQIFDRNVKSLVAVLSAAYFYLDEARWTTIEIS